MQQQQHKHTVIVTICFDHSADVGYDGIYPEVGYAVNVINKYFDVYFPRAANLSAQLRQQGYRERLVYTTHSWLVDLYTDCPSWNLDTGTLHVGG